MNEQQYGWTLRNRHPWQARGLFAGPTTERLLRDATRAVRARQLAAEAWSEVAGPTLRQVARVVSLVAGSLVIAADTPAACHYLRQQAAGLRRRLTARLPELRDVRFVLAAED